MADVRVQLPLGAFQFVWRVDSMNGSRFAMQKHSVWESLAIRLVRDQENVGSNPTTLTPPMAVRHDAVGPVLVRVGGC